MTDQERAKAESLADEMFDGFRSQGERRGFIKGYAAACEAYGRRKREARRVITQSLAMIELVGEDVYRPTEIRAIKDNLDYASRLLDTEEKP